jgi:hypothetical protein
MFHNLGLTPIFWWWAKMKMPVAYSKDVWCCHSYNGLMDLAVSAEFAPLTLDEECHERKA